MNIGRYLRGQDRHVGTARVSTEKQQSTVDIDPMDTPLPCDVKVGHVTIRKGVALRTLIMRMQVLYDMAQQRTWVGLTVEDRLDAKIKGCGLDDYIEIVEAKLKEKNGIAPQGSDK